MLNLLRMDIRRMLRSKSFYITLLVFILFSCYCIYTQAKWQVINGYEIPEHLPLDAGLLSIVNYYLYTPVQFMYIFLLKNGMIIFGIYLITFIAGDYQSGFIKNACMMCKNKNSIILNKFFITIALSVIITLLSFFIASILAYTFVDDFKMDMCSNILLYFITIILYQTAYFSAISFLYRLLKSKTMAIVMSVLFPLGITMLVLQPLLQTYTKYTLSDMFFQLPIQYDANVSIQIIILSIFYIVLYQGFSLVLFHKRDI